MNVLLANIGVEVRRNSDRTYNAYVDTKTCSGENYYDISSQKIGEIVADLIDTLAEEYDDHSAINENHTDTTDTITVGNNTFRVVDEVPGGYKIWNVGSYFMENGYIPLCRLKGRQPFDDAYEIESDTLLAIKADGADKIMRAIGGNCHTVALMEKFLEEHPNPKEMWEKNQVDRICEALPYMRRIKGL